MVTLERVPAEEREALRRLLDDYLGEFAKLEGTPISLDSEGHIPYEWFDAYWTEDGRLPFWITADGEIVGFCLLRQAGEASDIAEFYVLPGFRRRGIGGKAVEALATLCRGRTTRHHLIAKVRKWNEPALAFWRALGFRVTGEDGDDLITSLADTAAKPGETDDLGLLAIQAATLFELTGSGRLRRENSPDQAPAPRMWMGGSAAGNVVRIHVDVQDQTARAIEALAASEPPMSEAHSVPLHMEEYAELLGAEAPTEKVVRDVTYAIPNPVRYDQDFRTVASESEEGSELLARLETDGMPEDLVEMGFSDARHFWPPWCVVLHDGMIVSVAFTARLSARGAELGVATPSRFRGRGFAAAATAAWASIPSLRGRVLIYSTEATNASSVRLADRLHLRFVGPSLSIY